MNLTEVLNSVNYDKTDIFCDLPDVTDKEYVPFVVNKCLSYFPDTILQANTMNMRHGMDRRMQYHYLKGSIRKKKRFSKWQKADQNKYIEIIISHYECNRARAIEIITLLSEKEIMRIAEIEESYKV